MSVFEASSFLDATVETPTERRSLLPADDYKAVIGEPKATSGEKDGKPWYRIDVPLIVDVPPTFQVSTAEGGLGLPPTLTFNDRIFLDVTDSGAMDTSKGKNSGVRRYREALDMNKPGDAWSARKMQGRLVRVRIKHDVYEGEAREAVAGIAKVA